MAGTACEAPTDALCLTRQARKSTLAAGERVMRIQAGSVSATVAARPKVADQATAIAVISGRVTGPMSDLPAASPPDVTAPSFTQVPTVNGGEMVFSVNNGIADEPVQWQIRHGTSRLGYTTEPYTSGFTTNVSDTVVPPQSGTLNVYIQLRDEAGNESVEQFLGTVNVTPNIGG